MSLQEEGGRSPEREGGNVTMAAETAVVWLQAKEYGHPLEATGGKEHSPLEPQEGTSPADILTLALSARLFSKSFMCITSLDLKTKL